MLSNARNLCFVVSKESEVFALETDATGRFIVSADRSGIINVWDVSLARFGDAFRFERAFDILSLAANLRIRFGRFTSLTTENSGGDSRRSL